MKQESKAVISFERIDFPLPVEFDKHYSLATARYTLSNRLNLLNRAYLKATGLTARRFATLGKASLRCTIRGGLKIEV